jgi:hypothetical protein
MTGRKLTIVLIITFAAITITSAQMNKANLMKTVEYLSKKEFAGRLPGHSGYTKAAEFMAKNFRQLKLKPISSNYFQKLKVEYNEILAPEHFAITKEGKKKNYNLGKDYAYRGLTGGAKLNAEVVFCGYGLSQPDFGYDDYAGVDVKGKFALVFKYNPKWNPEGKVFKDGNPREKAIVAAKHGALGILFVSLPNDAEPQKPIGSVIAGAGEQMTKFPEVHIELYMADELFEGSGHTLKELQTKIDTDKKPFSVPLINKVDMEVHTKYVKEKEVVNVVGILEGSDPAKKDEYIIVGAHLDHVGSQAGKIFFPGANDNASGSAVVLQMAREFVNQKINPKRTIVFILFASEESGLNGATYFANHMPFSKEKVKVMINMDCIGVGDSIQIGGGKSAPELWKTVKEIDEKNEHLMTNNTWAGGGADAEPFFQLGMPTLYFVTTNSYKHLHMISDTPETLNVKLYVDIAKLAMKTVYTLSELK